MTLERESSTGKLSSSHCRHRSESLFDGANGVAVKEYGGRILVFLKKHDRVEEMIPCLEQLARPGMRVVFLVPYPVQLWRYVRDHWITTESVRAAVLAGRQTMEHYSWELQRARAERKVAPARDALRKKDIQVVVELYTGSLRKALRDYGSDNTIGLMMTTAAVGGWIGSWLTKAVVPLGGSGSLLSVRVFNKLTKDQSSRTKRDLSEQEKAMITENLVRSCKGAVPLTRSDDGLLEIVHDLKNCMSVLFLCLGNLEADVGSSAPNQPSLETLQNIVYEMDALVEKLVKLVAK